MRKALNLCHKTLFCAIALTVLASCGNAIIKPKKSAISPELITAPAGTAKIDPHRLNEILTGINERNRTVEDDPAWIKQSYEGLMIRKLTNLSRREFEAFKEYLDGDAVYVLVHPAYYTFFHHPDKLTDNSVKGLVSGQNVIEKFLQLEPKNEAFAVLQAQERRTRDFLEFMTTEKKLVIVVLPKNYQNYSGYAYKKGRDEYARYMNEATNFSKSVLFVESRSPNRGYLVEEDAIRLMEFLLTIKAKKVLIGGGYIGRCLEDFYALLIEEFGRDGMFIVPELSDISPREIDDRLASRLLNPDGTINAAIATRNMEKGAYDVQEVRPDLMNLQ